MFQVVWLRNVVFTFCRHRWVLLKARRNYTYELLVIPSLQWIILGRLWSKCANLWSVETRDEKYLRYSVRQILINAPKNVPGTLYHQIRILVYSLAKEACALNWLTRKLSSSTWLWMMKCFVAEIGSFQTFCGRWGWFTGLRIAKQCHR